MSFEVFAWVIYPRSAFECCWEFERNICRSNKLMLSVLATRKILKRKDVKEENAYISAGLEMVGEILGAAAVSQEQNGEIPEQRIEEGALVEVEVEVEEGALQQRNSRETVEDKCDLVTRKVGSEKEPEKDEGGEERYQREHEPLPESAPENDSSYQFQEVFCQPHSTTRMLDGVILVTCGGIGVALKVRICTTHDFDKISRRLLTERAVREILTFSCYKLFSCPGSSIPALVG